MPIALFNFFIKMREAVQDVGGGGVPRRQVRARKFLREHRREDAPHPRAKETKAPGAGREAEGEKESKGC